MQLFSPFTFFLLAALQKVSASPAPNAQTTCVCAADNCFSSFALKPSSAKIASSYCTSYIKYTPTVTKTSTTTTVTTVLISNTVSLTPALATVTATDTITPLLVIVSPTCSTSTKTDGSGVLTTSVLYSSRASAPGGNNNKRSQNTALPALLAASCGSGQPFASKISSACSCLLGPKKTTTSISTATSTRTSTITVTNTLATATQTTTVTTTLSTSTATDCQTATTIIYSSLTCGVPVSTYTTGGAITCGAAPQPSQTNARFRIEGNDVEGTIFDGPCIATGPESITTPSGGTHLCDGTNGNANPSPGGTLITAIDAAGDQNGFGFDGTFSDSYDDFFITSIGASTETGGEYWGVLRQLVFPPRGGCQDYNSPGEGLWAFDAFNKLYFLALSSEYAVVAPGQTVSLQILGTDGNGDGFVSIAGAAFAGQTSDANGQVSFTAPMEVGCYQYKATRSDSIRSAAFYLTVLNL